MGPPIRCISNTEKKTSIEECMIGERGFTPFDVPKENLVRCPMTLIYQTI